MARINAKSQGVRVKGLNELSRSLREMEGGFRDELKEANREAAELVARESRSAAYALGGVAAKAAPSLRASAGFNRAGVTLGGNSYPYALGAAFGGRGRPTTQQFQPHLGREGYFLYPEIRTNADRITETYENHLQDLVRRSGLA